MQHLSKSLCVLAAVASSTTAAMRQGTTAEFGDVEGIPALHIDASGGDAWNDVYAHVPVSSARGKHMAPQDGQRILSYTNEEVMATPSLQNIFNGSAESFDHVDVEQYAAKAERRRANEACNVSADDFKFYNQSAQLSAHPDENQNIEHIIYINFIPESEIVLIHTQSVLYISQGGTDGNGDNSNTESHLTSFVYRSTDNGRHFTRELEKCEGGEDVTVCHLFLLRVFQSPADPKRFLMPYGSIILKDETNETMQSKGLLSSNDAGATWKFMQQDSIYVDIEFSPVNADQLLTYDYNMDLIFSDDGGENWHETSQKGIYDFSYDSNGNMYATNNDLQLQRCRSTKEIDMSWDIIHDQVRHFEIVNDVLFAMRNETMPEDDHLQHHLHVSEDHGRTWNQAQFSGLENDGVVTHYEVVYSDCNDLFMIMLDKALNANGVGDLYIGDSTATKYTLSLTDAKYESLYVDGKGKPIYTNDVDRVESLPHTLMATRVYRAAIFEQDRTVISYDSGSTWEALREGPDGSYLSLQSTFHLGKIFDEYLDEDGVSSVYGVRGAPGVILSNGYMGSSDTGAAWVSIDGGKQWDRLWNGQWHFVLLDHGSVIVAVPHDTKTQGSTCYFSVGGGGQGTWQQFAITLPNATVEDVVAESKSSKEFAILARGDDVTQDVDNPQHFSVTLEWIIVDLSDLPMPTCKNDDYYTWRLGENGCILGGRYDFSRRKESACCFNDRNPAEDHARQSCECTLEDLECDYGFTKDEAGICKEDSSFMVPANVLCGETQYTSSGYVRIPGDVCKGGVEEKYAVQESVKKCPEKKDDPEEAGIDPVAIVVPIAVCLVAFIAVGAAAWVFVRRRKAKRSLHNYARVNQTEDNELDDFETPNDDEDNDDNDDRLLSLDD